MKILKNRGRKNRRIIKELTNLIKSLTEENNSIKTVRRGDMIRVYDTKNAILRKDLDNANETIKNFKANTISVSELLEAKDKYIKLLAAVKINEPV